MNNIHPTAIIAKGAKLGKNIFIGPYCVIGENVTLGDSVELKSHIVIEGNTNIGAGTEVFPFASIGHIPQDKKYNGEHSRLVIGKKNVIREYVTINPGTKGGGMVTRIGDGCLLMVGCHVAHDCQVGDKVILANNATLAGHVEIGSNAILGGLSAVRQYVRIGEHAMIGGMAAIESDVIPYGIALNERGYLAGINIVGLKRCGFDRETINAIRSVYNTLFGFGDSVFSERLIQVENEYRDNEEVMKIIDFLKTDTSRAICKPKSSTS
jgi:UDP-N-acetylglucosamine acyltransferase